MIGAIIHTIVGVDKRQSQRIWVRERPLRQPARRRRDDTAICGTLETGHSEKLQLLFFALHPLLEIRLQRESVWLRSSLSKSAQ